MSPIALSSLRQALRPAFVVNFIGIGIVGVCGIFLHVVIDPFGAAPRSARSISIGSLPSGQPARLRRPAERRTALYGGRPAVRPGDRNRIAGSVRRRRIRHCRQFFSISELRGLVARQRRNRAWDGMGCTGAVSVCDQQDDLAVLNGLNRMIWYAMLQTLRFVTIVGLIIAAPC